MSAWLPKLQSNYVKVPSEGSYLTTTSGKKEEKHWSLIVGNVFSFFKGKWGISESTFGFFLRLSLGAFIWKWDFIHVLHVNEISFSYERIIIYEQLCTRLKQLGNGLFSLLVIQNSTLSSAFSGITVLPGCFWSPDRISKERVVSYKECETEFGLARDRWSFSLLARPTKGTKI